MEQRKLTALDVRSVTGYNRDELRGLLQELPAWSVSPGKRRARTYTADDLTVLSVVRVLDVVMGMRRKAIATLFPDLRKCLLRPRSLSKNARLVVTFDPLRVEYIDGTSEISEGIVISVQPLLERVDQYLGVAQITTGMTQATLKFGPSLVKGARRRRSSS